MTVTPSRRIAKSGVRTNLVGIGLHGMPCREQNCSKRVSENGWVGILVYSAANDSKLSDGGGWRSPYASEGGGKHGL